MNRNAEPVGENNMTRQLHAVEFDGITFGMSVDTSTEAYKRFKKSVTTEEAITRFGNRVRIKTVPYLSLAAIMQETHWLVSERKCFNKISIDGTNIENVYIKYTDEMIDFKNRRK